MISLTKNHKLLENVSVIVPVYNSALTLNELTFRISEVLCTVVDQFEIILINDGSNDESWQVICKLAEQHKNIHGVDLTRNYGQHNALLCGIRFAKHQSIVTIDDDLQNPPDEIPKLLGKLSEGFDVVYGKPQKEQHSMLRAMASRVTKLALSSSMGIDVADNVSAFRAFRTGLRNAVDNYRGPFVNIDVLLTWATTRFTYVYVRHDVREFGKSNYTFRKLVIHALNMMTGFSILPLQISSIIGFSMTLFGFFVLVYVLGRFVMQGGVVPGFSFLASIITIFSGAQLLALGIIGEYLSRMHFRTMDRPSYTIRSEITNDT